MGEANGSESIGIKMEKECMRNHENGSGHKESAKRNGHRNKQKSQISQKARHWH